MSVLDRDAALVRLRLGGCRVDVSTSSHLGGLLAGRLTACEARPLYLASANLDHVRHFGERSGRAHVFDDQRDVEWQVLLDGMPLVWLARLLTGAQVPLLAGSDLLEPVLQVAERCGARLGVLGGSLEMHDRLRERLAAEHPRLPLVCALSPARPELSLPAARAELAAAVRECGVDVLVVGLGKPRQEEFLLEHGPATGARVAVAFGAAADFYAGTASRVAEPIRGSGLEWLYRLAKEPRRLGSRYLLRGPADVGQLLRSSGVWAPELAHLLADASAGHGVVDLVERGAERRVGDRRAPVVPSPLVPAQTVALGSGRALDAPEPA